MTKTLSPSCYSNKQTSKRLQTIRSQNVIGMVTSPLQFQKRNMSLQSKRTDKSMFSKQLSKASTTQRPNKAKSVSIAQNKMQQFKERITIQHKKCVNKLQAF
jgi:hypothetical protein